MKKSLIALAALATVATGAQAQSNVTIYGILDMGIVNAKGLGTANQSNTTLTDPMATSRLGFRGTEDLGGGLRANFNLEQGIIADTGAQGASSNLFNRQSWVGLEKNGLGSVQLGRTTRLDFDAVVGIDPVMGAANFGTNNTVVFGAISAGTNNATAGEAEGSRFVNSAKFSSARMAGFQVSYQHSFGETTGNTSAARGQAYSVDYTQGKAKATYAYARANNSTGAKAWETSVVAASYDFGKVRAHAGYAERQLLNNANDVKVTFVGASAPISAKTTLFAQYNKIENQSGVNAADADTFATGALYALSKRTTVYGLVGRANNDPLANVAVVASSRTGSTAVGSGKDQTAYAVGVRHSF